MAAPNPKDNGHVPITQQLIFEGPCPRPENVPPDIGVEVDQATVQAVERQTRGQRKSPDWFSWRQFRITASMAHDIAHSKFANGRAETLAKTYVKKIMAEGQNLQNIPAMNWGIQNEALAVQQYQDLKNTLLGHPVTVQECGLFIDPLHVWLGATPDGIVEDEQTGERLLCLEVKCPHKHRRNTVRKACLEDKAFCLELSDEDQEYRLRINHKYYTQVQCQMAVTGIHKADLAVFTLRETVFVPVTFDPEFWDDTVTKLGRWYREFLRILPDRLLPDIGNLNLN